MLLTKNFLHLTYLYKKNSNLGGLLNFSIFYTIITKQVLISYTSIIFFSFFFKQKIVLSYYYFIKIKVPNLKIFNSTLISILCVLNNINVKVKLQLNVLKKSKNYFTTLRSPFVHKTSREQFIFEYYEGILSFCLPDFNNYIVSYLEFFLKKSSSV